MVVCQKEGGMETYMRIKRRWRDREEENQGREGGRVEEKGVQRGSMKEREGDIRYRSSDEG